VRGAAACNAATQHSDFNTSPPPPPTPPSTAPADLNADPLVRFQHKWYLPLVVLIAFVLPTLVCGLGWGDYYGGYFIAGVARLVVVHHSTFFVNSLAHYAGAATYTDRHTARNSWITALLTLGEGYHNFHHEFPSDYRNGIEWYQYDPTKVFIWVMSRLGLATELQEFPANEVEKGKLQMRQKELDGDKRRLNWGPDPATLPIITEEQLAKRVSAGEGLVLLDGFVLDVGKFMHTHPGGVNFIRGELGKDVSAAFKAEVYRHSQAARNLAATFRVARLQGYWA
jgi:stearoyl-CoA desaturase (Delta-9 desaturase)